MPDQFRAHHILCTALYEGKGYSGSFCENMTAIVERLRRNPDEELFLVGKPDVICANCPNLVGTGGCESERGSVEDKDRMVMERCGLKEREIYSYRALCGHVRKAMSEELFGTICGGCEWQRQGLCRYTDLMARLKEFSC